MKSLTWAGYAWLYSESSSDAVSCWGRPDAGARCGWLFSSVQFVHLYCATLTAKTVTSAQSNLARRPNGTATFSICFGIVRVSGLRHRTIEVVSSSLLSATLKKCVVRTLTFRFAGNHHGLRNLFAAVIVWYVCCGDVWFLSAWN